MGLMRKILQAVLEDDGSPGMYGGLIEQRAIGDRPQSDTLASVQRKRSGEKTLSQQSSKLRQSEL
jgi:hypothetical protein